MQDRAFDADKAAAFGARLVEVLNGGALALMLSIGHRTGLFDVMARLPPAPSATIASQAGLAERYVREWLGALVSGRIVEYEPLSGRYWLPPEHAAALRRDACTTNVAAAAQTIPLLGAVEDEIVRCFERGGGVPGASYERLRTVMAESREPAVVDGLFTHVLPAADGLCDALASGIDVLHVGCESGRALPLLARQFPRSRFLGIDSRIAPIARAKQDAAERRLANLRFERCDVTDLARPGVYGLVLGLDGIHDHARPEEALAAIAGALRHEGRFVLRDVSGTGRLETDAQLPLAAFLYTISCLHGLTVSLADDGAGLGTMWSEETARQMLAGAGFADVVVRPLPDDPVNRYYLARRAS